MPEGDTIFRAARTLHAALHGQPVTEFRTELAQLSRVNDDTPLRGRTIEKVTSVGKHLLFHFSGDLVLRTHMRMHGSWHIYRRGERWRRSASSMRIAILTAEWEAVGFNIPIAEFVKASTLSRDSELSRLGPDVLGTDFDAGEVIERLRKKPKEEIGNALLDQTILAGVGNVFKSEILFVCRTDPFRRIEELDQATLAQIVEEAERELKMNVTAGAPNGRRTTRTMDPGKRLSVYGRRGKPCSICGTAIEWRKQGKDARSTYWCSNCQK